MRTILRGPRTRDRITYHLDNLLKSNLSLQLLILLGLVLLLTIGGGTLRGLVPERGSFAENLWWAFLRITDAGYLGEDSTPSSATVGTIVIIGGLAVFGLLISLLNTAIQQRLDKIKGGRTWVVERDHTVILGWNSNIYTMIDQLIEGDIENRGGYKPIVVMSSLEPARMQELILLNCLRTEKRRIICRRGDIGNREELVRLSLGNALQVMILSGDASASIGEAGTAEDREDARAIKALFAACRLLDPREARPRRGISKFRQGPGRPPSIGIMLNSRTATDTADLLNDALPEIFIHPVNQVDFVARIIAQACIIPGIEVVFEDLFGYSGCEIYLTALPPGETIPFARLHHGLGAEKGVAIGVYTRRGAKETLLLNPPDDHPVCGGGDEEGDLLVWIGESKDRIVSADLRSDRLAHQALPRENDGFDGESKATLQLQDLKFFLLGEGRKIESIRHHLVRYVDQKTIKFLQVDQSVVQGEHDQEIHAIPSSRYSHFLNRKLELISGRNVIVIADTDNETEIHDALVLLGILKVSNRENHDPDCTGATMRIVAEFLDARNEELAQVARNATPGDSAETGLVSVVSTRLLCNYLVQTVRRRERRIIFQELLSPEGCEINLVDAMQYLEPDEASIPFHQLMRRARRRRQTAIGILDADRKLSLNPPRERLVEPGARVVAIFDSCGGTKERGG